MCLECPSVYASLPFTTAHDKTCKHGRRTSDIYDSGVTSFFLFLPTCLFSFVHLPGLGNAPCRIVVSDCTLSGLCARKVLGRNCRFLQGPDTDPKAIEKIRKVRIDHEAFHTRRLYGCVPLSACLRWLKPCHLIFSFTLKMQIAMNCSRLGAKPSAMLILQKALAPVLVFQGGLQPHPEPFVIVTEHHWVASLRPCRT